MKLTFKPKDWTLLYGNEDVAPVEKNLWGWLLLKMKPVRQVATKGETDGSLLQREAPHLVPFKW